jgi:phosphate starvation-inducible protein PhoH
VNDVFLNYYTQKEIDRMIFDKIIDFGPIAHMRGRTFTNAYIIADEMQNSTPLQMKMLLTRIGEGSKMIITGDLMQSDLKSETNGLADFIDRYKPWIEKSNDLQNIHLVWLTHMDVFRSETVKAVIKVYEGIENYYKLNKTQEIVEDTNDGTPELTLYHDNTTYIDEQNSSSTSVNGDSALIPISHISRYFKDNDYTI